MKQTVEEAAIEGAKEYNIVGQTIYKSGFKAGAEWKTEQMKEKAIESYIENCEYKSEWCCGCAEAHGAILSEPDVCMGRDCPTVKQFIEKLNS